MERKTFSYSQYLRSLHRDIGYFVIGLTVIFTLSGLLLVFRDTAFLKYPSVVKKDLQTEMGTGEVQSALKLKRVTVVDTEGETYRIVSGNEQIGIYDLVSGKAEYTTYTYPNLVNKLNMLHKATFASAHSFLAIIYGILLLFLALSPLCFHRPGSRLFRRSLTYLGGGLVFAVAAIALV
ncbi:hypothetical protein [Desulfosediminicola sp.]|uniref:hypothetical protein n=1 Tax=Desulfosediminicola sp. TaxID=2886825 RepID=UPI003AF2EFC7